MIKQHTITQVNFDVRLNLTKVLQSLEPSCLVVLLLLGLLFITIIKAGKMLTPMPMTPRLFELSWLTTLVLSLVWISLLSLLTYLR